MSREPEIDETRPPAPPNPPRPVTVGPVRFGTMDELRRHLEKSGSDPWIGERRRQPRACSGGGAG